MSGLQFEREIALGKIAFPKIAHEPDNGLWLYGTSKTSTESVPGTDTGGGGVPIYLGTQVNFRAQPTLGLYDNLVFEERPPAITHETVAIYGVKHVSHFGAGAFYVPHTKPGETTKAVFVIPVHKHTNPEVD